MLSRQPSLRAILVFDAVTCVAMGAALLLGSAPIAALTALPPSLLLSAGLALLPIAAVIAFVARWPSAWGVWMVVAGNLAWVGASLLLLASVAPNALGLAFVLAQAVVVAAFARLEYLAGQAAGYDRGFPRPVAAPRASSDGGAPAHPR